MLVDLTERGREGKTGRETSMQETNINQLPLLCAPAGDQTCNLGMCPDQNPIPDLSVYGITLQMSHTSQDYFAYFHVLNWGFLILDNLIYCCSLINSFFYS